MRIFGKVVQADAHSMPYAIVRQVARCLVVQHVGSQVAWTVTHKEHTVPALDELHRCVFSGRINNEHLLTAMVQGDARNIDDKKECNSCHQ